MSSSWPRTTSTMLVLQGPLSEPAPAAEQGLIEAQLYHRGDPVGIRVQEGLAPAPHRRVDGVPVTAQHRRGVRYRLATTGAASRPTASAGGQQRPLRRDGRVLLTERARRTPRARAAPAALVPHQPPKRREVHQLDAAFALGAHRPAAAPTARPTLPTPDVHPQRPSSDVIDAEHLHIA